MLPRRLCSLPFLIIFTFAGNWGWFSPVVRAEDRDYRFDKTISREVLENYLSRAISVEGILNGKGDLDENIRFLKDAGVKYAGRSICLWGGEANLLRNFERAKEQAPKVHAADPNLILEACIFERTAIAFE